MEGVREGGCYEKECTRGVMERVRGDGVRGGRVGGYVKGYVGRGLREGVYMGVMEGGTWGWGT